MIQPPGAIDLTVCEQLIIEEKTHNITLVNCLARLKVRQVPPHPSDWLFTRGSPMAWGMARSP